MSDTDFLSQLQAQAHKQAKLNTHRLLPKQLDVVTSFIGRYPWQVLVVISGCTSAIFTWWAW